MRFVALIVVSTMLAGCNSNSKAATYTLYRTSSIAPGARVHWATFDAGQSDPTYNLANCQMAARLLTANMKALNGATYNPALGFWCEEGGYRESGGVPPAFGADFPTDTQ